MEKNGKTPETTGNNKQSKEDLLKAFTKPGSASEIKDIADKISEADPDIDNDELDKKEGQFHRENREDAKEEAENDAEFEQPKTDGTDS